MHFRLIFHVADQYVPDGYDSIHKTETRIRDEAVVVINDELAKYGLKEFISACYREESPFMAKRKIDDELTVLYWQEMVVCLYIEDHAIYNKAKLKYPNLVSVFNGETMRVGKNKRGVLRKC